MKRLVSALLLATAWTAALASALGVGLELLGCPSPPPLPDASAAEDAGTGFRLERGHQHIVSLRGAPYALGWHNARLTAKLMRRQEEHLFDGLFAFAGSPAMALLIRKMSLAYLTGFDQYLSERDRLEILGLATGTADPFPAAGPRYSRLAAYHAMHELSHRFAFDNAMFTMDYERFGCSLVAVGAAKGRDGHTLLARNFDFGGGEAFDRHKVVLAVRPKDAYGFVSVSWGGMAGVVTGVNEHGLAIVLNAGASQDYRRVGAPTTLLIRHALEQARTVDEAITVITGQPRFVSDILGLADRQGRVAVLELTPHRHTVRVGDVLTATNHMESPELRDDPVNLQRQAENTTLYRRQRLQRRVKEAQDPIGVSELLSFLRDRNAPNGGLLPLGHRHAIDSMIAIHSVIIDVTDGKIWVSEGPHTLGPYHGYDVAKMLEAATPEQARDAFLPSLEPDPLYPVAPILARAEWALGRADAAVSEGDLGRADELLQYASQARAFHPRTLIVRGRLASARGERDWAVRFFRQALRAPPEYASTTELVEKLLRQAQTAAEVR